MGIVIAFVAGVVIGAAVALLAAHLRGRAAAQAMQAQVRDAFGALAAQVLSANSEQFLRLANQSLSAQTAAGSAELEQRKQLIERSIQQMSERLEQVRELGGRLEAARKEDYGQLGQRLGEALNQVSQLRQTTDQLRVALAHPQRRGTWGENMADDILQMAGMINGVNYTKQQTAENGRRPDFTFLLPNAVKLNMDVKFPLDNYLKCISCDGETARQGATQLFMTDVRRQMAAIATREYIDPAAGTAPFALMFIPNEQVFAFIQEFDKGLLTEAAQRKVLLVGPLSLLAVLAIARQAAECANLSQETDEALRLLGEFSKQWGKFKKDMDDFGTRLRKVVEGFDALTSTRSKALERPLDKLEQLRLGEHQEAAAATGEIEGE
jgi:DNA recombination protein RmuC